jgi:hypothetical protein
MRDHHHEAPSERDGELLERLRRIARRRDPLPGDLKVALYALAPRGPGPDAQED